MALTHTAVRPVGQHPPKAPVVVDCVHSLWFGLYLKLYSTSMCCDRVWLHYPWTWCPAYLSTLKCGWNSFVIVRVCLFAHYTLYDSSFGETDLHLKHAFKNTIHYYVSTISFIPPPLKATILYCLAVLVFQCTCSLVLLSGLPIMYKA